MATARLTASDLDELLHKSLGKSRDWSQSLRLALLNQAQNIIAARKQREVAFEMLHDTETFDTVASTQVYELTATNGTHILVRDVLDPSGRRLERKDLQYRNAYGEITAADGQWGWYPAAPATTTSGSSPLAIGLLPTALTAGRTFTAHLLRQPRSLTVSPTVNVSELPPSSDLEILRIAQIIAKSVTPGAIKEAMAASELLGSAMLGTEDGLQPSIEHQFDLGVGWFDAYEGMG